MDRRATGPPSPENETDFVKQLRAMNETLLVGSVRQHELTDLAQVAEAAARESNSRFEALFEASPIGMYLVDAQFRIRLMSASAREVFGNRSDLIGADFIALVHDIWPPAAADEILKHFRNTLETGEPFHSPEFSEERFDLKVREHYDWQINRINLPHGQHGVVCSFIDISARVLAEQKLRESEVRYRRLFQSSKDGVLILDAKSGKIIDANAFMSGLLGQELSEIQGKELWEIGLFPDAKANKDAFKELLQQSYLRYDHLPLRHRNGGTTFVEFVSNVYKEGDRLVAQCSVRDISDRVAMEQKIRQQAESLADQARHKDEFLAMLSHELRNPLAPIRSATHLLRLQEKSGENPLQQQAREVIERQVTNLTRLISDLMEVSRALTGRIHLNLEVVDMNQLVRHAIETATPTLDKRGQSLSTSLCTDPVWAQVDATRMEEVFINLLVNAAKYTQEGGKIDVTCERHDNHALVHIRDNGAGIDAALLPRIFDLFSQADRTLDRAQGGLGIGLSLAHRIVELHGGSIEARSDGPTKGSEFTVRLQLAPAPGINLQAPAPEIAPSPQGLRILVVDDNVDACLMLANLVRLKAHGVQSAYTGTAALAIAESWRPDVILLDIGLPEVDGYEVARRLRAADTTRAIRLVAVTGYGAARDMELGREAGFDAHLIKPVDLAEIEKLLVKWASNRPT